MLWGCFLFFFLFENTQPSGQQTSKMLNDIGSKISTEKNNAWEMETVHSLSVAWWVLVLQYFFPPRRLLGKICICKMENLVIIFTEVNAALAKPEVNKVILIFTSSQELIRFGKRSTLFLNFQNVYLVVLHINAILCISVI